MMMMTMMTGLEEEDMLAVDALWSAREPGKRPITPFEQFSAQIKRSMMKMMMMCLYERLAAMEENADEVDMTTLKLINVKGESKRPRLKKKLFGKTLLATDLDVNSPTSITRENHQDDTDNSILLHADLQSVEAIFKTEPIDHDSADVQDQSLNYEGIVRRKLLENDFHPDELTEPSDAESLSSDSSDESEEEEDDDDEEEENGLEMFPVDDENIQPIEECSGSGSSFSSTENSKGSSLVDAKNDKLCPGGVLTVRPPESGTWVLDIRPESIANHPVSVSSHASNNVSSVDAHSVSLHELNQTRPIDLCITNRERGQVTAPSVPTPCMYQVLDLTCKKGDEKAKEDKIRTDKIVSENAKKRVTTLLLFPDANHSDHRSDSTLTLSLKRDLNKTFTCKPGRLNLGQYLSVKHVDESNSVFPSKDEGIRNLDFDEKCGAKIGTENFHQEQFTYPKRASDLLLNKTFCIDSECIPDRRSKVHFKMTPDLGSKIKNKASPTEFQNGMNETFLVKPRFDTSPAKFEDIQSSGPAKGKTFFADSQERLPSHMSNILWNAYMESRQNAAIETNFVSAPATPRMPSTPFVTMTEAVIEGDYFIGFSLPKCPEASQQASWSRCPGLENEKSFPLKRKQADSKFGESSQVKDVQVFSSCLQSFLTCSSDKLSHLKELLAFRPGLKDVLSSETGKSLSIGKRLLESHSEETLSTKNTHARRALFPETAITTPDKLPASGTPAQLSKELDARSLEFARVRERFLGISPAASQSSTASGSRADGVGFVGTPDRKTVSPARRRVHKSGDGGTPSTAMHLTSDREDGTNEWERISLSRRERAAPLNGPAAIPTRESVSGLKLSNGVDNCSANRKAIEDDRHSANPTAKLTTLCRHTETKDRPRLGASPLEKLEENRAAFSLAREIFLRAKSTFESGASPRMCRGGPNEAATLRVAPKDPTMSSTEEIAECRVDESSKGASFPGLMKERCTRQREATPLQSLSVKGIERHYGNKSGNIRTSSCPDEPPPSGSETPSNDQPRPSPPSTPLANCESERTSGASLPTVSDSDDRETPSTRRRRSRNSRRDVNVEEERKKTPRRSEIVENRSAVMNPVKPVLGSQSKSRRRVSAPRVSASASKMPHRLEEIEHCSLCEDPSDRESGIGEVSADCRIGYLVRLRDSLEDSKEVKYDNNSGRSRHGLARGVSPETAFHESEEFEEDCLVTSCEDLTLVHESTPRALKRKMESDGELDPYNISNYSETLYRLSGRAEYSSKSKISRRNLNRKDRRASYITRARMDKNRDSGGSSVQNETFRYTDRGVLYYASLPKRKKL